MDKEIGTFDFGITKITEKVDIERREKIDSAIIGAMHHILSEKGIERKFILYEENLVEACKNYIEGYASVKAEVAREIFEEIERFLYMNFRFCKEEIGNDDTQYIKGRLELNTQIQNLIAELKKKYAEGK